MKTPEISTVKEHIAWSYANLARADAALKEGVVNYKVRHHMIRAKLYKGLVNGHMSMRSLYHDERLKMMVPQACYYCGRSEQLCVDHLIPRIKGGSNDADNLIWSCRSCNASKQGRDMLEWMKTKNIFPPILLLRRYIKIVARFCERENILDCSLSQTSELDLPFNLILLPYKYPPLNDLKLWILP